jgi:TRAP-type mannitol/chloroaromatic compound transport system permease small subunit
MPRKPPPALIGAIRSLDRIAHWTGVLIAWLIIPMVGSLVYEVTARYVFDAPTEWAYDMTFMLYGSYFMIGAAYTLFRKGHIRTDSFYGSWSPRVQGWVDAACYLAFFFPAMVIFTAIGWEFFVKSWQQGERIVTSPWMPIVYPFKFVLPLSGLLLILQGISEFLKSVYAGVKGEWL